MMAANLGGIPLPGPLSGDAQTFMTPAEKKIPADTRKKAAALEELVIRRFGHFGPGMSGLILDLIRQPPIVRKFMKKFALDAEKNLERQLDGIEAYVIENGSANFLMRGRYEISRALHQAERLQPEQFRAARARAGKGKIIKTETYEGPDRRRNLRDRRVAVDRRNIADPPRNEKRARRERRLRPGGRRKTDAQ